MARSLPPHEAYRLWAPTYDAETPVSLLDDDAITRLTPPRVGRDLLDAACGTARRLPASGRGGPRTAVGVDIVREMLAVGRHQRPEAMLVQADVRLLPFAAETFDIAWCRLAAGHLPALPPLYEELVRLLRPGGWLILTDFHPTASEHGHRRTFRDANGARRIVEHHVHRVSDHQAAAQAVGFRLDTVLECPVGPLVKDLYEAAGAVKRYQRDLGLPLVIALRFQR